MNFGALSGWINGTEQVVFDHEVTGSAVSSISTGNILNGDEDGWYTIIIRFIAGANGAAMRIRPNNDSGTNYGTREIDATNTTVSNSVSGTLTGFAGGYSSVSGYTMFTVCRMYAKSGAVRLLNQVWMFEVNGTTVGKLRVGGNVWNNTADNITSMSFVSETGTDIGVGTRIIILKSNNFTNGTPCGAISTPYIKGAWVRVGSQVLASAASSVAFSGLDGDRDVVYYLSYSMKSASASATDYTLRLNNDSTSAIYGYQLLAGLSTTVKAERGTAATLLAHRSGYESGYYGMISHLIFAKSGFVRPVLSWMTDKVSGTTVTNLQIVGHVYNQTSNNITSIDLASTVANGFGTGSQFELYALRPNG